MISVIQSAEPQATGGYLVTEQHTTNDGETFIHTYIAENTDLIEDVCQQRGINIENELQRRLQVLEQATQFEIPLTPVELMRRLTPQEWHSFQSSIDLNVIYFREVFNKTTQIYRNDPLTQAGIQALVGLGILTAERAVEVMQ